LPRTALQRAEGVSKLFKVLLPVVLSAVGILLLLGVVLIPDLRNAPLIASITGLLSVVGVVGISRGESR
jgi:hypothetical protein